MIGIKKVLTIISMIAAFMVLVTFGINYHIQASTRQYIMNANQTPQVDAIVVLGARVFPSGNVSDMLEDRLDTGVAVYRNGKAAKILVSGDHGRTSYDEVNAMKKYLMKQGLKDQDVFMDHAGFSTYETIYRARDIFRIRKMILVTQSYHLPRAIYLARKMGIVAYGVAADKHFYPGIIRFKTREVLARSKDFIMANLIKPRPTYLGTAIPIYGDGRLTNDSKSKVK